MTNYDEPSLRRARSVDADTRGMMQIRRRLGDVLVESGLLTPQQLEKWDAQIAKAKEFLGHSIAA